MRTRTNRKRRRIRRLEKGRGNDLLLSSDRVAKSAIFSGIPLNNSQFHPKYFHILIMHTISKVRTKCRLFILENNRIQMVSPSMMRRKGRWFGEAINQKAIRGVSMEIVGLSQGPFLKNVSAGSFRLGLRLPIQKI